MGNRLAWLDEERVSFFAQLERISQLSPGSIALRVSVHPRTFSDWRRGKSRMPEEPFRQLVTMFSLPLTFTPRFIEDKERLATAGRLGGIARQRLYGNLGTPEGRRRGGLKAMVILRARGNTAFKFEKVIRSPSVSPDLAEFCGLMMGDGGLTSFQAKIYGCISTDSAYKEHVLRLGKHLFGISGTVIYRPSYNCWCVTFSSTRMIDFLVQKGLPLGNKLAQGLNVPLWIREHPDLINACIRGIFDTDGCVYLDHHRLRGQTYLNLGVAITTASPHLLKTLCHLLREQNFSPTVSGTRNLLLRRSSEIERFFQTIRPSNAKHWRRYREFLAARETIGRAGVFVSSQV